MAQETKKATIVSSGEKIEVYKSKLRDSYINAKDCTTEYKPAQLKF